MGLRFTPCLCCGKPVFILFDTCPHCRNRPRPQGPVFIPAGTREYTMKVQWSQHPHMKPAWANHPPYTVDADGKVDFLPFNPGWIAISGRELERQSGVGHDSDVRKVAQRAKDRGHIEDWKFLGGQLFVKLREQSGQAGA